MEERRRTRELPQTDQNQSLSKPTRRFDIDWLRTLVVLLLIPFHAGRLFDTHDPFYIQNEILSEKLTFWWLFIGHALGMQFLFLLAGSTTWLALRFRNTKQYIKERFLRLVLPLIFGVLVIVPWQPYYGMRGNTGDSISFLEFYPHFFEMPEMQEGYTGGFTVAHLWFILFLFLISLLALPLFLYFRRESGGHLVKRFADFFAPSRRIFLLAIPLIGLDRLVDYNWNSLSLAIFFFLFYLTFFLYGYFIMADPRLAESIDRVKRTALIFGPALFFVVRGIESTVEMPFLLQQLILHLYYRGTFPWFTIIAVLGYGKQYLNFPSKFLLYFGEASYPAYILHQSVVVAVGYYIVQWEADISSKYLAITFATYAITFIIYEGVIRRYNPIRFLFGMRPKRNLARSERSQVLRLSE
jgi:glucan biosynthesis protein C